MIDVDVKINIGGLLPNALHFEDDLPNARTMGAYHSFHLGIHSSTPGQIHVAEIMELIGLEELGEAQWTNVGGVKEQQLFELLQRADVLQAERRDVLHVVETEFAELLAFANLLAHAVIVIAALQPEHFDRVPQRRDDEADGPPPKVAVEHELLEVLAHPHNVLGVVVG